MKLNIQNCTVVVPESKTEELEIHIPLPGGKAVFSLTVPDDVKVAMAHAGKASTGRTNYLNQEKGYETKGGQ